MPPAAIMGRVLLLFICIGVAGYGLVWFFRYLAGAWTRWQAAKIEKKVDDDEKVVDTKIKKMYATTKKSTTTKKPKKAKK
jgi:high-affinity Fe2+/Pb2+ permease